MNDLTKREWFAGMAWQGLLGGGELSYRVNDVENCSMVSFKLADAMLAHCDNAEADRIIKACNSHSELLEALKKTTAWMQWWLDQNECECEQGHTCGKTQRQNDLDSANAAIAKAE